MTYDEMLKTLYSIHPETKIKLGLDRIKELLKRLGNPQDDFEYIHVTGTNGKGTVVRTVGKILSAHELKVGTYFSPHLETFRERIRVNDIYISKEDAVKVFELVSKEAAAMSKSPDMAPTFFEIVTAMAFLYFKFENVDVVVSEVGLGGRFDATNVVEKPLCTVITSVDYDHMETLGSTLSQIAFEKAGIIKSNVPVVVGEMEADPLRVISSRAKELNSKVKILGKNFRYKVNKMELGKNSFDFIGNRWKFSLETRMNGIHAMKNLSISLATLEELEKFGMFKVDEKKLYDTIFTIAWEGRFEWLPSDVLIILDVAHNTPAMKMLSKNLSVYFPNKKINAVIGILNDKDYEGMIDAIAKDVDKFYITTPHSQRATDAFGIYSRAMQKHNNVGFMKNIEEAVNSCLDMCKRENSVMVVSGSFYTVGVARTFLTGNVEADKE